VSDACFITTHYFDNKILFYAAALLSSVNLILPYTELTYRSANLSIPEILGYNNTNTESLDRTKAGIQITARESKKGRWGRC
jgi:hypothetical protein